MFEDNDIFNPTRQVQRQGDWFEQRKQYRAQALVALRKREGLPSPVDADGVFLETRFDDQGNAHYYDARGNVVEHVLFAGAGKDGKPGGFAIGKRKGAGIDEASASWYNNDAAFEHLEVVKEGRPFDDLSPDSSAGGVGFDVLEVSEDGRKIKDELNDLNRDSAAYELAERVSHGPASQQAPEFILDGLSDEAVDASLQEYLKRGPR
jgi:hypothetical protein